MNNNIYVIAAFAIYLGLMMYIGVHYYRRANTLGDYILGGRQLGPWITSMSAEASDMSGWMLMGLPGFAYSVGLPAIWIAIGLALGTWLNWIFVSKRLRNYTEVSNNSLTLPEFLRNRFHETNQTVPIISAIFILIFFLIYTSSGFVAGGRLFTTIFGLSYNTSLAITAGVVIFYTFLGGFHAVAWTDFIQGMMMFFSILLVPMAAVFALGGPVDTSTLIHTEFSQGLQLFEPGKTTMATIIAVISSLGWGLGYFGQPHILVRFMAISNPKELTKATKIAMTWVIISLSAAVFVGLIGHVYLHPMLEGTQSETVFLTMTDQLFSPFVAGIIWSAVLAAIMSTASSQLLVTSSAVSQDLYKNVFRPHASEKETMIVSRVTVLIVSAIALILALNPDSYILNMVAYAWAGFGGAFGPAILISLLWRRMTHKGCVAGIIVGGLTVLIWRQFAWFDLYEIVPGFILSSLAIIIVSLIDKEPKKEIVEDFDKAHKLHIL